MFPQLAAHPSPGLRLVASFCLCHKHLENLTAGLPEPEPPREPAAADGEAAGAGGETQWLNEPPDGLEELPALLE